MGKTTAPLLSFDAAGAVGQTVVYSRWRGVKYARRYVIPANPRTTSQQLNRNSFAVLREMYKLAPDLARAPWGAFATGRPFTGFNAFIGENRRAIGTDVDMSEFIGSPGARGGLPPDSVTPAATASAGEIAVDFTTPTPPTGWTLSASVASAFAQQAPDAAFSGPMHVEEITASPWDITFTGLTSAQEYVVSGWLRWLKPDGKEAYSPSITGTATPV